MLVLVVRVCECKCVFACGFELNNELAVANPLRAALSAPDLLRGVHSSARGSMRR